MLKQSLCTFTLASILALSLPAIGADAPKTAAQDPSMMHNGSSSSMMMHQGQAYVIPAGTSWRAQTLGVPSGTVGSQYVGQLIEPVMVNGVTVIPVGSHIHGQVVSMDPSTNWMNVEFRDVSTPTGETIPIRGRAAINRTVVQGRVVQQAPTLRAGNVALAGPTFLWTREPLSPVGRIVAGTVGGAIFGGATGTLTGLVWPAVYRNDIDFGEGTGAVRGLAWGAVMGAGLGLVTGTIAALAEREPVATTTTGCYPATSVSCPGMVTTPGGLTNIQTVTPTGEVPVGYPTTTGMPGEFNVILEDPVTVTP